MKSFVGNLLLAFVWAALTEEISGANVTLGFVLGYGVLYANRRFLGTSRYVLRVPRLLAFVAYFFWKMLEASVRVAYDILTPTWHMRPGVIAVPLAARTDLEIMLLSSLITLTPGTLGLDVSADRRTLYVHAFYLHRPEEVRREIKEGFERRLLELLR
jgi:multicomponent Na+:H+ antiporter subunit E